MCWLLVRFISTLACIQFQGVTEKNEQQYVVSKRSGGGLTHSILKNILLVSKVHVISIQHAATTSNFNASLSRLSFLFIIFFLNITSVLKIISNVTNIIRFKSMKLLYCVFLRCILFYFIVITILYHPPISSLRVYTHTGT